jgi:hypothetical protein
MTITSSIERARAVGSMSDAALSTTTLATNPIPRPPDSLEETGLSEDFVAGLVLKALHTRGATLGFDLFDTLALPASVLDDVVQRLQERRLVEVHSTKGPRRGEWVFELTDAGRSRAIEEMDVSRYVGPAPVPFDEFRRWVELQTIERARVSQQELRQALDGVVTTEDMLSQLGPAINSGRSLFLYGDSGNGKTLLAERIARVFGDRYYVPHCVQVDGSLMMLYDAVHHGSDHERDEAELRGRDHGRRAGATGPVPATILRSVPDHDLRYVEARRPVVVTGGELTLEQLDLQWDPTTRMYQAPPQLKAAGGVLVIDDLGRQRAPVQDLLNRWVVPLEQRRDHLTLGSGRKVVVPFDCFVIFSTNLEPNTLGDEAFVRRIHYKVHVRGPRRQEYERIFRSSCEDRGIAFDQSAVDYLFHELYAKRAIEPRRCHPRDVLDHVEDLATYRGEPLSLSPDLLQQACRSYFGPFDAGRPAIEEADDVLPRALDLHVGFMREVRQ